MITRVAMKNSPHVVVILELLSALEEYEDGLEFEVTSVQRADHPAHRELRAVDVIIREDAADAMRDAALTQDALFIPYYARLGLWRWLRNALDAVAASQFSRIWRVALEADHIHIETVGPNTPASHRRWIKKKGRPMLMRWAPVVSNALLSTQGTEPQSRYEIEAERMLAQQ